MYAFVFDFDGPIFDGRGFAQKALNETFAQFHPRFGAPTFRFDGLPLLDPIHLIHLLYAELQLKRSDLEEIEKDYTSRLEKLELAGSVIPEVKEILKKMHKRDLKLSIFSARPIAALENLLEINSIRDCFQSIVGNGTIAKGKPSPEGLQRIAKLNNVSPSRLVFIGDSALDFQAAQSCGAIYYHAAWTGEPSNCTRSAHAVIEKPSDLYELLDSSTEVISGINPTVPDYLDKVIKNNELSFYAGAGISIKSGIGGWNDHYERILQDLNMRILAREDHMDIEDALQLVATRYSKELFDNFKESFEKPDAEPNAYHFCMLRSSAEHIWTSNYDHLFESANAKSNCDRVIVTNDQALLNNFANRRAVIKMNGDFEGAVWNNDLQWDLVFLREQFDTVEEKRREIWRSFEDDYRNKSIIFVGLSFTDSALRRIISVQRRKIPRARHDHYFLAVAPTDPIASRKAKLHSESLSRMGIRTLFFQSYDDLQLFVNRVALSTIRPTVGFSGDVELGLPPTDVLPGGMISVADIERFCSNLGKELATAGIYQVVSGGAPGVGIPAVTAAFEVNSSNARFYFRRRPSSNFARTAPAIIVPGDTYLEMRKRLIGATHFLIAIGGRHTENSGVVEEVELALKASIPVLLIPQAGGVVSQMGEDFRRRIPEAYKDNELRRAMYSAYDEISAIAPQELLKFASDRLPVIIDELLLKYVASSSPYRSPG